MGIHRTTSCQSAKIRNDWAAADDWCSGQNRKFQCYSNSKGMISFQHLFTSFWISPSSRPFTSPQTWKNTCSCFQALTWTNRTDRRRNIHLLRRNCNLESKLVYRVFKIHSLCEWVHIYLWRLHSNKQSYDDISVRVKTLRLILYWHEEIVTVLQWNETSVSRLDWM